MKKQDSRPLQILNGWKEIANYLGKGVRTVQRYERELAFPVRRPAGKPRGSVLAVRAEVDGWLQASPIQRTFVLQNANWESNYSSSTREIKEQIARMNCLRDEMAQLKNEVRETVEVLWQSVFQLQGELNNNYWSYSPSHLSRPERQIFENFRLDPLQEQGRFPKAS
jgi:predicted DNA-binding transcriptional regulator AlpA